MRNFSVYPLVQTNSGHEMDQYASRFTNWQETVRIMVGSPKYARQFLDKYQEQIEIQYYVGDADVGENVQCISEDDMVILNAIKDGTARIICVDVQREKFELEKLCWEKKGAILNETFFQAEVLIHVWQVYQQNLLVIDRVEIFLTSGCTLNCEKCIAYIPYFKQREYTPLSRLKEDISILLSSQIDRIVKLKLLGGEVFLYPELRELLLYIHDNWADKVSDIRLGTNGTIYPSDKILEICRQCNVTVDISDYSSTIPNICKFDDVNKYISQKGVNTEVKRQGEYWFDMGFPNNIPPKRTIEDERKHYFDCAMFCRQFAKGKYYFCCSCFAAEKAGLYPDEPENYLDMRNSLTKKQILEYELGFNKNGYTNFCRFCQGGSDESNDHHIKIAEQAQGRLNSNFTYKGIEK